MKRGGGGMPRVAHPKHHGMGQQNEQESLALWQRPDPVHGRDPLPFFVS